jgi:hypothetical protein
LAIAVILRIVAIDEVLKICFLERIFLEGKVNVGAEVVVLDFFGPRVFDAELRLPSSLSSSV